MSPLSLGKIRCMQQLTNEFGVFAVAAFDHRDGFVAALTQTLGEVEVSWQRIAAEKIRIAQALGPHSSGVLLDPLYSAGPVITAGALPGNVGFAVAREKSSYGSKAMRENTELLPDWSVGAIKRMGGAAVKLLLYYHPEAPNVAEQEATVQALAAECEKHEILFMLEPICYPLDSKQRKTDPDFAQQRPEIIMESARRLVPLGADILKVEFPTEARHETDQGKMTTYCRELSNITAGIPWVLLSAGVDFPTFQLQTEIACAAGASGVVVGRAVWREALDIADAAVRDHFLSTIAVSRMRVLTDTVNYRATPWATRVEARMPKLEAEWYIEYNMPE